MTQCRGNLTIAHPKTPKRAHYVTYCERENGLLSNVSGVEVSATFAHVLSRLTRDPTFSALCPPGGEEGR
jgi:hypothetical protein